MGTGCAGSVTGTGSGSKSEESDEASVGARVDPSPVWKVTGFEGEKHPENGRLVPAPSGPDSETTLTGVDDRTSSEAVA